MEVTQVFVGVTATTLDFCEAAKVALDTDLCEGIQISANAQDSDNTYVLFDAQTLADSAPLVLDLTDNPDMYGLWDITFSPEEDDGGELSFGDDGVLSRRLSSEVTKVYEFSYPCRETTVSWAAPFSSSIVAYYEQLRTESTETYVISEYMTLSYGDNDSEFRSQGGSCPQISHYLDTDSHNAVTYLATDGSISHSPNWSTNADYSLALTLTYADIEENNAPLEFGYVLLNF